MILGTYPANNHCMTVYWSPETGEISEDNGYAEIIVGYAETEQEAMMWFSACN